MCLLFQPAHNPDAVSYTHLDVYKRQAFDRAVLEIAGAVRELMDGLVTSQPPRDREVMAAKARARAATRYNRSRD